jgi:hypothetical protein
MKALHYVVLASVLTLACSAQAFLYIPNNPVYTPPPKFQPVPQPMPRPLQPGVRPFRPTPGPGIGPIDPAVVIYSEDNIPVIYQNVFGDQYKGPNAGSQGHCGYPTWFPYAGSPVYPYPSFIPDSQALWPGAFAPGLSPMTGYGGDGDTNSIGQIGGLIYQAHGLQGGNAIGVSMAPRALTSSSANISLLANYWFCSPNPTPWNTSTGLGIQVAAIMTFPFVYVPGVGDNTIGAKGTVFTYFVVQIGNVNDSSQVIYIAPRLLQDQYPAGADASSLYQNEFGPGNQIWHDGANNPILFPELRSGSWISQCSDGSFNIGHNSVQHTYCFTMSAAQLSTAISNINQASQIPRHNYDTTAANWQVRILNIDMESWAPSGSDPRMGLNFKGLTMWQL